MTIGIWGDSISYGSCDDEALGWPGRLRKSLPRDDWHTLYNFGICGDTSTHLLKRFNTEAAAIQPSQIFFAIGINDAKFPDGNENLIPLTIFDQNLKTLIEQAHHYTTNITIVSATPVDESFCQGPKNRFSNNTITLYNEVMRAVAEAQGVHYAHVFTAINPAIDLADGLHPNTQGYEKLYQALKNTVPTIV